MTLFLDTSERQMVKIMLFLCLFVSGAGACLQPDNHYILILTNEALLKNDFPEGSNVTYRCSRGYTWVNGTGAAYCIDGQWTEPDLHCRKKDCGPLKERPNMRFEYSKEGTLFAASVKVVCDKGYKIRGQSFIKCYEPGWIGRSTCEVVSCPKPVEIAYGRNSWKSEENPKYEDVIQFFCDEGFTLIGNTFIKCNETGKYNSQPPECKRGTNNTTEVNDISTEVTTSIIHTNTVTTTREASTIPPIIQRGINNTTAFTTSTIHTDTVITTRESLTFSPLIQGNGKVVAGTIAGVTASILGVVTLYILQSKKKGYARRTVPISG